MSEAATAESQEKETVASDISKKTEGPRTRFKSDAVSGVWVDVIDTNPSPTVEVGGYYPSGLKPIKMAVRYADLILAATDFAVELSRLRGTDPV